MSLSRQERRRMAREAEKRSAFYREYGKRVEERQNNVDDRVVELYTTCMGLAVADLYGNTPFVIRMVSTAIWEIDRIYRRKK